jgi:hypothetical protein
VATHEEVSACREVAREDAIARNDYPLLSKKTAKPASLAMMAAVVYICGESVFLCPR